MSGVFERLQFNYDTSKFGNGQYLTQSTIDYLNVANTNPVLSGWEKDDVANGVVSNARYFKNPHANVTANLTISVNGIYSIANTDFANVANVFPNAANVVPTLVAVSGDLMLSLDAFRSHTDNISGVTTNTGADPNVPDYDSAVGMGHQMLILTNQTDQILNTSPMLGSFTSLFCGPELAANDSIMANDWIILKNSLGLGMYANVSSNLTSAQVNSIIVHVNTLNELVTTRKNHDWNFFKNSRAVENEVTYMYKFKSMGNTQMYLVNNYIGTDLLKANLANT